MTQSPSNKTISFHALLRLGQYGPASAHLGLGADRAQALHYGAVAAPWQRALGDVTPPPPTPTPSVNGTGATSSCQGSESQRAQLCARPGNATLCAEHGKRKRASIFSPGDHVGGGWVGG